MTYNIYRSMIAAAAAPRKAPHPGEIEKRIRRLAADGAFSYGKHVFDRKEERDIDLPSALEVLRLGVVSGDIEPGINTGEWRCKMVAKMDNGRWLGVVTVVGKTAKTEQLFFITVEWEDTK